ncbi:MAG: glutamine amidotransferase [Sandaracinus sp.]|nr:glutamine amidotransferase [Sandaracinus sp.]
MRKPFLVLKTGQTFEDLAAKRGDYEDWFLAGLGVTPDDARVVDVRLEAAPPHDEVRGVVITGSSSMVTDREPWSEALRPWLRRALELELPTLAVCYGHQLLADELGGDVGGNPRGRQIGTVPVTLTDAGKADPLLGALGDEPLLFQATHRQSVRAMPPGVVSLASSPRDPNHAFRAGPRAWAVQFHPEIDHAAIAEYVSRRREAIASEGDDPDALLAAITPSEHGTKLLRRFAELADEA